MQEPPASGPISTAPRALRPAELQRLLPGLAPSGVLPTTVPVQAGALDDEDEFAPVRLDLLAGSGADEPVSTPPRALRPARDLPRPAGDVPSGWRRR